MDEKELIGKIKELRRVKPNQNWVFLTKNRIFGQEEFAEVRLPQTGFFEQLKTYFFMPVPTRALVPVSLVLLALIAGGSFLSLRPVEEPLVIVERPLNVQEVIANLEQLEVNLNEVSSKLIDLKGSSNRGQALALTETVKNTARQGKELVEKIEVSDEPSQQVLASLYISFDRVEEETQNTQKEILAFIIEDLRTRALSDHDQRRLQEIEEHYNNGRYEEAIALIAVLGEQ